MKISAKLDLQTPRSSGSPAIAAVIIAAFRAERWIEPCLVSLIQSVDERHHIYVVDNGENNGSVPNTIACRNYTVLYSDRTLGFAEANNFALVRLGRRFDYFCFLNQDTVSTLGWLDRCIACMEVEPRIGALMPTLTRYDGTGVDPAGELCLKNVSWKLEMETPVGNVEVAVTPQITAAAMVARAEVVVNTGPFDPVFGSYYEDYDLSDRIKASGHVLGICLGSEVAHFSYSACTDPTARIRKDALSLSNRALLTCRRNGSKRWRLAARFFLIELPRRIAAGFLARPGAPSLKAVLIGYLRLARILPRLVSSNYDQSCFDNYLIKIGWNEVRKKQRLAERQNI